MTTVDGRAPWVGIRSSCAALGVGAARAGRGTSATGADGRAGGGAASTTGRVRGTSTAGAEGRAGDGVASTTGRARGTCGAGAGAGTGRATAEAGATGGGAAGVTVTGGGNGRGGIRKKVGRDGESGWLAS